MILDLGVLVLANYSLSVRVEHRRFQTCKHFTSCIRFLGKPLEKVFPSKLWEKKKEKGPHNTQEMGFRYRRATNEKLWLTAGQEVWKHQSIQK